MNEKAQQKKWRQIREITMKFSLYGIPYKGVKPIYTKITRS